VISGGTPGTAPAGAIANALANTSMAAIRITPRLKPNHDTTIRFTSFETFHPGAL
jgi:hypothetical protein